MGAEEIFSRAVKCLEIGKNTHEESTKKRKVGEWNESTNSRSLKRWILDVVVINLYTDVANALNILLGEYICTNETQKQLTGACISGGASSLIQCKVKNLPGAWHVGESPEGQECLKERGNRWCMSIVNSAIRCWIKVRNNCNPRA